MLLPIVRSVMQPKVELPPVLYQLPDFNLKNQDGESVNLKSFEGSAMVVNFIFTSCPGVCPMFSKQMAKIQNRIVGLSPAIRLLSISVDPETDTPSVLKNYGNEYKANFKSWSFLTGPLDEIKKVVTEGFKLVLQKSDSNFMDITHGEHFVIVDQIGQIRAFTHARNDTEINNVIKILALVANTNPYIKDLNNKETDSAPIAR